VTRSACKCARCFNPRLPGGKATVNASGLYGVLSRFNPRLPGGKATCTGDRRNAGRTFQSTPSGGEGDMDAIALCAWRHVSIHAFRGGRRRITQGAYPEKTKVSIHAFRGGRRHVFVDSADYSRGVSIHAFRGGRRPGGRSRAGRRAGFNPRLPGGKATSSRSPTNEPSHVSIHAFRGGRRPHGAIEAAQ